MARPRTLLLTRPARQSAEFAAALEAALPGRFRVLAAPVIDIDPLPGEIDLAGVAALAFTSANGVEQFAARVGDRRLPAFCVGDMTAEAARQAGFEARSADGDVAALARIIVAAPVTGGAVLHIRGRHAAGDLVARLADAGVPARAAEIYRQRPVAIDGAARAALERAEVDVVALFSPRSAALFSDQAESTGWDLSAATSVALGTAADARLAGTGFGRRLTARRPGRGGMIAALALA